MAAEYLIPGVGIVNDGGGGDVWLIPGSGVYNEQAAGGTTYEASTTFSTISGIDIPALASTAGTTTLNALLTQTQTGAAELESILSLDTIQTQTQTSIASTTGEATLNTKQTLLQSGQVLELRTPANRTIRATFEKREILLEDENRTIVLSRENRTIN